MIYSDFVTLLLSKSNNRTVLPDEFQLKDKIYSSLKRVAKDTVPLRLVITDGTGQQILRKIDEYSLVRYPFKPLLTTDVIDIDDALLDAVALFTMAGMETQRAKQFMGLYYKEIELNNERLVETNLSVASNDSPWTNTAERFA